MTDPPPSASAPRRRWRRAASVILTELGETAVLLALLVVGVWLLAGVFGDQDGRWSPAWLVRLGTAPDGQPLAARFLAATVLSGTLLAGSLLIAVPLSTLVGWAAARFPALAGGRFAVTLISALPMVAAGAFVQRWSNALIWPILVLAVTEMTLGTMAAQVYTELQRELSRRYLDTARAKGVAPIRHYWKPLVGILFATIRPRIPYLLGATIVVERIFTFERYGLANLVFTAMEQRAAPAVLFWVGALGLLLVRAIRLAERLLTLALDPRAGTSADGAVAAVDAGVPLRSELLALVRRTPWILAELPRRLAIGLTRTGRQVRAALARQLGLGAGAWLGLALGLVFSAAVVGIIALAATGWRPHDPTLMAYDQRFASPSWSARSWLGRDALGRDLASLLLLAGSNLLLPALAAVALPIGLGTLLGLWTGTRPEGRPAQAVGALMDLVEALPKLILILAAIWTVDVGGGYLRRIIPLIGLCFTPQLYYAVRDRVRRVASEGFVEAQRALGAGPLRIVGLHLLWHNCRGPVLVQGSLVLGHVLMLDLTLGYLGYAQPNEDLLTWGGLAHAGIDEARQAAGGPWNPWVLIAPLGLVALFTVTLALWGEALRELFGDRAE